MNRQTADITTQSTDDGLQEIRDAFAANPETPAARQARLAGADIDSRSLALARQVEAMFARDWTGGPAQRQSAIQVLIGDALRDVTTPPISRVRWAPVQRLPGRIPWAMHLRAYEVYASKYGRRQSAERMAERGGFGVGELDMFIPGWRDELAAEGLPA